jgi:hypothetical protein
MLRRFAAECDALKAAASAASDEFAKLQKAHSALAIEKEAEARSMVRTGMFLFSG